jgi:hypothetical protein
MIVGIKSNDVPAATIDTDAQEMRTISLEILSNELSWTEPMIAFTKCTPPESATKLAHSRNINETDLIGDVAFAP